ncbi:MAG: hypothetical protein LBF67_02135 [Prevotellaceae bacterium]|nr:hypothetical protein [Prevotellaceae bacterium]
MKRFNPTIYPQRLWVAISKDGTDLNGLFRHQESNVIMLFEEYNFEDAEAVTLKVTEVKSRYSGVLIAFTHKNMKCSTIAHEAVHAAGFMFKSIGQQVNGDETFAYLVGWIADCCCKIVNGKAKQ